MKKYPPTSIVLTACLVFSSCSVTQPLPALLEQPSVDSRLSLETAVGDLFNSQPITLASDVFQNKSIVIIEPRQPKGNRGNLLDGRETREADTVSLLIVNRDCYVRHNQSGEIKLVPNISCKEQ